MGVGGPGSNQLLTTWERRAWDGNGRQVSSLGPPPDDEGRRLLRPSWASRSVLAAMRGARCGPGRWGGGCACCSPSASLLGETELPPGPMCLLAGVARRRGITHAGSNPGRGSHTQSPLKEHLSRACTGPRKIPKCPGRCSSSDPTLCAPRLLSPAQPRLWWEGAGGLRCWKGNLSPGPGWAGG